MPWLVLALTCATLATAAQGGELTLVSQEPVQLAAERLVVRSERLGRDFQVDVWTPATRPWLPGQKAAVAYILDGGYGMAGPIAAPLGNSDAMQAAYIVTVDYLPGRRQRESTCSSDRAPGRTGRWRRAAAAKPSPPSSSRS